MPGEIGENRSELVKTGPKSGQIGRNVPRNTKIPREEASKSQQFFDKKGSMVGRLRLESQRPATGLRTPKSPKVPGRVPGKGDRWEQCWEAGFFGKAEKRHCSQQCPQQSSFSRHSSQHSLRHFWGFGRSQSCSRSLGFQA